MVQGKKQLNSKTKFGMLLSAVDTNSIRAMVWVVKLCLPVSHFEISESRLFSNRAKSFWVSPLAFRISLMRSAIPKDKSNSAFCSAGIAARQSRNNLFCIITIKFQRLHFLCLLSWHYQREFSIRFIISLVGRRWLDSNKALSLVIYSSFDRISWWRSSSWYRWLLFPLGKNEII